MGVSSKEEQERAAFENDMGAHVAQLMGFAKPFTSRLPASELTKFLKLALDHAWGTRQLLGTQGNPLLVWWGHCLRDAAEEGGPWRQVYSHGTFVISGYKLGRGVNI